MTMTTATTGGKAGRGHARRFLRYLHNVSGVGDLKFVEEAAQ
jgi:hypothetical protein